MSLFFMHEDTHQGKVAFETTTFGWVWPVVSHVQSYCIHITGFFDHLFTEKNQLIFNFHVWI